VFYFVAFTAQKYRKNKKSYTIYQKINTFAKNKNSENNGF